MFRYFFVLAFSLLFACSSPSTADLGSASASTSSGGISETPVFDSIDDLIDANFSGAVWQGEKNGKYYEVSVSKQGGGVVNIGRKVGNYDIYTVRVHEYSLNGNKITVTQYGVENPQYSTKNIELIIKDKANAVGKFVLQGGSGSTINETVDMKKIR